MPLLQILQICQFNIFEEKNSSINLRLDTHYRSMFRHVKRFRGHFYCGHSIANYPFFEGTTLSLLRWDVSTNTTDFAHLD